MRYTPIDQVEQGEYLGKPIYSSDGRVLLEENVLLTVGIISRLRYMGIEAIYIKDKRFEDIEVEDVVSEQTKREVTQVLANSIQYIQSGKKDFQLKAVSKISSSIIEEIMHNKDVLMNLSDIRTKDNVLFLHSFNVCVISVLIGMKMGLDRSKLKELAIGSLFHDIGKISVADHRQEEYNEEHHTWKGFNLLRKNPEISKLSLGIILQHHEYIDGSGAPRGIKGDEIHLYAKIASVANAYDNMVAPIDNSKKIYPYEACERIMAMTNIHFDHEVVWHFLRSIAFYPTGSQVKLTNGETGVVVGQNRGLPQRPIIRVFKAFKNSSMDDYEMKEINLAKETTVFIKEVIS